MSTQTSLEIDIDDGTLSIDGFELEDDSVASHFAEVDEADRAEEFERVLRLGVETAGLVATTGEEEYGERKFEEMRSDFEDEIERVEEEVEEKFGTDGEVPAVFESHLGEDGTLQNRLDDAFGEDGVFVDRLDDELGEDGERIQAALDPDTDGTPIQRLRNQLREDISQLRDKIEEVTTEEETREEMRGRTRLKGDDFEDTVEELLSDLVYGTSHSLEYTGETTGEMANEKVGDFVLTLDETDQRIVVEAKSDKGYNQPDIQEELDRAIENRDADYGIIVFECEEYVPDKVGYFHEFETDRLTVALSEEEEEGELEPGFLRIAFNWAKTRAVQNYASTESETDLEVVQTNVGQVEDKIGQFSAIRSKTTSIKKTANGIDEELEEIETEIKERLTAIRTELAGDS